MTQRASGQAPPPATGDGGVALDGGVPEFPPRVGLGLGGGDMRLSENRILVEVAESPFDAPSEPGIARLACVSARFNADQRLKSPANGIVTLPRIVFKDAREFTPEKDCVVPP